MIVVRDARVGDIEHVASRMRSADQHEVYAFSGLSGYDGLRESCRNSVNVWSLTAGDRPICMFGVVPDGSCGVPWALGTDDIEEERIGFLRASVVWRDNLLRSWSRLSNWTDVRHVQSHGWLKWLGFTLGEQQPAGVFGMLFRPFWMDAA